jgi:hypothetical protein
MFEILVNGTPRNYRDQERLAIDAGRMLKRRDKSEIAVVNTSNGMRVGITDPYAPVGAWTNPPVLGVVRPA